MSINIADTPISKLYLGSTEIEKAYLGSTEVYGGDAPTPVPSYDYAIVEDIKWISDFIDVFERYSMSWYKLNNLDEYEAYGVYGDSRNTTTYTGKLVVEDGKEYEWDGTEWVYVGEGRTKEYAVKERPIFAKAYATLALAEADIANVGLNAAAVLPNDDVYTFTANGLVATPHYKVLGRLTGDTECLYEPSSRDKTVTDQWQWYLNPDDLETVIIDDATLIDEYAFAYCISLTSVTIGNSVETIGTWAFGESDGILSVTIGNSVETIGERAFGGCRALTSLTIGNSVETIGNAAFAGCLNLPSITIPNSVTSIGDYAFQECISLTSLTLGSGVETIGELAFGECGSLTSVTVMATTPPALGFDVFEGCYRLSAIHVHAASVDAYKAASGWSTYANIIRAI